MTRILFIRHGQSLANAKELFAGNSDFDLSPIGHEQAARAAKYLRENEKISAIYSSDLLRAYNTACPIGKACGIPVIKDVTLREIYAGEWESLSFTDIAKKYPEEYAVWMQDYSSSRPVGGESTQEVYERIVPHVLELAKKHDGETILISTHATVLRAFTAYASGYSSEESGKVRFSQNASINVFAYDDGKTSVIKTDVLDHLGELVTFMPKKINA